MFEDLILHKTPVYIYLYGQEKPIYGMVIRYDARRGLIILSNHVVIPEQHVLKIKCASLVTPS